MRPHARILGVAAAWALLGSGCDFWRNLTEPHKAEKVDLVVTVKDAWTGEALPWARCSLDSARANADAEGRVLFPGVSTGRKSLACSSESYHRRAVKQDAVPGAGPLELALVRKGYLEWYPQDPARQLRIDQVGGNFRFPGKLVMQASPRDAEPIFQYAWTSTRHGALPSNSDGTLSLTNEDFDQDTVVFTLSLLVHATLEDTLVEVGRSEQAIFLIRNKKPTLTVTYNAGGPQRVGPGCDPINATFIYSASDPDGGACSVRFTSLKLDSPLGDLNTVVACGDSMLATFPLGSHDGLPEWSRPRSGPLRVSVQDDNGGMDEDTLEVATYSNLHPQVRLEQIDDGEHNFAGDSLRFHLFARDGDATLKTLTLDWKDGTRLVTYQPNHLSRRDSMDVILTHSFEKAGTYDVEATTSDGCRVTVKDTLRVLVEDREFP